MLCGGTTMRYIIFSLSIVVLGVTVFTMQNMGRFIPTTYGRNDAQTMTFHINESPGHHNETHPNMIYLMVMFTTFQDSSRKRHIHINMMKNWAQLNSDILPVLYVKELNESAAILARQNNWVIRLIPRFNNGLPVIKSLYQDAFTAYKSTFYGYSNADILYDNSLTVTLKALQTNLPQLKGLFVVGQRKNAQVLENDVLFTSNDVNIRSNTKGSLFQTNAQDYFITTAQGYNWSLVPNFVPGRPGYDNWLVVKALDWGISLIDTTATITALHQTGGDGNFAGFQASLQNINYNLAGWSFIYHRGLTSCAPLATAFDLLENVYLYKKINFEDVCQHK